MKKTILLACMIMAIFQQSFGQSAVAKIKFEEAEEAYSLNKYELTISKLKEVEALLKTSSPRILYLQISALSKMISANPYNDFALLENTRKLSNKYLKVYETLADNEAKYRDIYKISESLKAYPVTKADFDAKKILADNAQEEKQMQAQTSVKMYEDNFMNYQYYKGYKIGLTEAETIQLYPVLKKHYTINDEYGKSIISKNVIMGDGTLRSFYIKNNKVWGYWGEVSSGDDEAGFPKGAKKVAELIATLKANFNFDPIEKSFGQTQVKNYRSNKTTYTWGKNNKKIWLEYYTTWDGYNYSYGLSIFSQDENLAK